MIQIKSKGRMERLFSIHFVGKAASNKMSSTEAECKEILVSCGNLSL